MYDIYMSYLLFIYLSVKYISNDQSTPISDKSEIDVFENQIMEMNDNRYISI